MLVTREGFWCRNGNTSQAREKNMVLEEGGEVSRCLLRSFFVLTGAKTHQVYQCCDDFGLMSHSYFLVSTGTLGAQYLL